VHTIDILLIAGIGKDADWNELLSLVANRGTLVLLAAPESLMTLNSFELIMRQVNVTGSLIGGRKITAEMLDFASKHDVRPWIEKYSMSDINKAVQHVIDGNPRYRVVMETEAAAKI
jgi:alcohol dehydrogenase (NADP+)